MPSFPANPIGDDWSKMLDDPPAENWFVVAAGQLVGTIGQSFAYRLTPARVVERHALYGQALQSGDLLPAKGFGPGADIQRQLDLGTIAFAPAASVLELRETQKTREEVAAREEDRQEQMRKDRAEDFRKSQAVADAKVKTDAETAMKAQQADEQRVRDETAKVKTDNETKFKGGNGK